MAEATDGLVGNNTADKSTKAASSGTSEAPSKSTTSKQIDENLIQPIGISKKEIHITRKATSYWPTWIIIIFPYFIIDFS